ncbi:hypothetical protein [Streptomyces abyssomicinicus]|uniref:hypothetical protein n=1 Tax=Streptomyces abyssomicinicus TaxID=574929 RepID=UPI001250430F|nr:hypothetical protein [Streptomyces abyssomicinicus]
MSPLSSSPGRSATTAPGDRDAPDRPTLPDDPWGTAVAVHRPHVPVTAVRGPLVRDGVLFHIDVRHRHLAAVTEGRIRVVLPSVPADAVLCAVGDELRIARPVPGGFAGVGFHVREGLSTCPVPRSFPPALRPALQAAAAAAAAGGAESAGVAGEYTQIRTEAGGLSLELSLPSATADALIRAQGTVWPVRRLVPAPAGDEGCSLIERLPGFVGLVAGAASW